MKPIQEPETSDSVETGGDRRYANHAQVLDEAKRGYLYGDVIDREASDVGAAEFDGRARDATAEYAVVFVEEEIKDVLA
jgi:hypothetical protein